IACCSPPSGTYHPADIESPGFTGGYSQLVLSGQAATLKHSNLINTETKINKQIYGILYSYHSRDTKETQL
ncbi:hypothetical protein, partial [Parabacteroides caecihominis]|uniref:hypothetical protein n=1 Tax=Parabacteroides sp. TA-V-105 TaxID=2949651 RepID=UPI00202F89B5